MTDMIDLHPSRYGDDGRWIGTHGVTAVMWPCPRCAVTLTAPAGCSQAQHDCPDADKPWTVARKARAAERVAAWWAGYDAAVLTTEPCREDHVPPGAICTPPTFTGLLALTPGDHGFIVALADDNRSQSQHVVMSPIMRAVLIARLRAWADLLTEAAATTPAPADSHDWSAR